MNIYRPVELLTKFSPVRVQMREHAEAPLHLKIGMTFSTVQAHNSRDGRKRTIKLCCTQEVT